jgi:hypothetical protein
MFDPMFAGDPLLQFIPWAVGLALAIGGFLWIRKIVNDIEDN